MKTNTLPNELCVIPLTQTVLFPESETQIKVSAPPGDAIKRRTDQDDHLALCLLMKKNQGPGHVGREDFHTTGTLIKILNADRRSGSYRFDIQVLDRVEINHIRTEGKLVLAGYRVLDDVVDMDEKSSTKMLEYMKEVTHDIGRNFKGAEPYLKLIEEMDG